MADLSLAFDILARDRNASRTFNEVGDSAEKAGKKGSGFGTMIKGAMAIAAGAIAAAGIGDFFKDSIAEARESQKVGALTAQVIKSTGAAAKVTADQVGELSTAISNRTGIDDEAIQSGANLLLTFKNIRNEAGKGNDIFNQTTGIMTDMATAMGQEPKAAAIQLGKALNDPIKGISALSRVGVTFSDSQKKAIKTMVESGDTMGAQKIILKELQSEFGGAAEASATAGDKFKTTFGNFKEQIGTALLPILDKVLGAATSFASYLMTHMAPALDKVGKFLKPVIDTVELFIGTITGKGADVGDLPWMDKVIDAGASVADVFKKIVDVGKKVGGDVVTAVKDLAATFGPMVGEFASKALLAAPGIFDKIGAALKTAGAVLTAITGFMRDHATAVQAVAVAVGAGVLAWKAWTTAITVWQAVTKAAAAIQVAFNAVMSANPVMLVVIAIAALAAGLIYAYKHSETFRDIVNGALHAVADAGKWMWESVLKPAFEGIKGAFKAVGDAGTFLWEKALRPAFKFIADVWLTVVGGIVEGAATAFGWVPGVGPKLKKAADEFDKLRRRVDDSLDGIGEEAEKYGSEWARGLARGIARDGVVAIATAQGIANKIAAATRAAHDTNSPSRVAELIGRQWDQGLAKGMLVDEPSVTRAALLTASAPVTAAQTAVGVREVGATAEPAASMVYLHPDSIRQVVVAARTGARQGAF